MPVASIFLLVGTNILPADASNNEITGIEVLVFEGLFGLEWLVEQIAYDHRLNTNCNMSLTIVMLRETEFKDYRGGQQFTLTLKHAER